MLDSRPKAMVLKLLLGAWLAVCGYIALSAARADAAPGSGKVVLVAPINGMIDLGLGPFVARVLERAQEQRAAAVVLNIDTFGGRVDAAVAIRDSLLRSRVKTVAFVNKRAISAGALITLAAEKVVIARGGTIGAATPVEIGGSGESKPVGEKTVSYVRKEFRSTADARGRPGLIAEAMVDADVEIPGVIEKGKLLTLTTDEAVKHKVADFVADDLNGVLAALQLSGAEVRFERENWAERVVRFLTHPVVSSLLMTLGILGLVVELRTPGFGFPGAIGFVSLFAFFWGHWLVELAGWEQIILLVVGLALIALEVFVLPGFGIAGIGGIALVVLSLSTSLFGEGASWKAIGLAASRVMIATATAAAGFLLVMRFLPRLPGSRRLVLEAGFAGDGRDATEVLSPGTAGVSITPLRPAGIAQFGERRVDVVSLGEFLEAGCPIELVRDEGHRVVVRARSSSEAKKGADQ
jgi:membrane-bound serine protease (ClpP class)